MIHPKPPRTSEVWVIREYYEIVWHSESQKWYIRKTNQKSAFIEIVWNSEVSCGHGPRYVARPRSCPSSAPGSPVAACFDAMDIAWKGAVVIHDDPTNLQHLQKVTQCDPWNPQPKLTSLENAGQCPKTFGSQSQSVPDIPPFEVKRPVGVTWDPGCLCRAFTWSCKDGPLLDANGISWDFQYVSIPSNGWNMNHALIRIISHWHPLTMPPADSKDCCSLLLHRTHSQVDKVCQKFLSHLHGPMDVLKAFQAFWHLNLWNSTMRKAQLLSETCLTRSLVTQNSASIGVTVQYNSSEKTAYQQMCIPS